MDTTIQRRRINKPINTLFETNFYKHDLNIYRISPSGDIHLSEFESLALERLQLLRIIEQASFKNHKPFSDDWRQCIKQDLIKAELKKYVRLMSGYDTQTDLDIQARRSDHLSHFIMRLAYCRSEDLRRWFISREMDWFKLRFINQTQSSIVKFLNYNNLTYNPITADERDNIKSELLAATANLNDVQFETTNFYRIPFTEVCPLVKARKVFLKNSFAYVPESELIVCILSKFRAELSEALNIANHKLPLLDDDRLVNLLSNVHNIYTGRDYVVKEGDKNAINPANLDMYAKQHFPLCMKHLHSVLKTDHHLKHNSRLQYGLFLKGIGLMYEQAMEFWRTEFTKSMDDANFTKNHEYNFKHMYGKVGRMVNYSPYGCMKIIMGNVGANETHGCTFKHSDPDVLKQKLIENGLSTEGTLFTLNAHMYMSVINFISVSLGVQAVLNLTKEGHYQIACSKYFELTHNQAPSSFINHPNQYYEESYNLSNEKK